MDFFFGPMLEHFCPLFAQIAQMGSLFGQMGSLFAQISTSNPCSLLCSHTPLLGICTYIKRWKMRSEWLLPPAERPRESCSVNAEVRARQRECDGVNAAA